MSKISEDVIEGKACSLCTCYFVDSKNNLYTHGFPVVCNDCWSDLTKSEKRLYQKCDNKIKTL